MSTFQKLYLLLTHPTLPIIIIPSIHIYLNKRKLLNRKYR